MSVLLIESFEKKITKSCVSAHARNSLIISEILDCDLISHYREIPKVVKKKYDHIVCCYSSNYMQFKEYYPIIDNNKDAEFYWLLNDHHLTNNVLLKYPVNKYGRKYHVISNNIQEGTKRLGDELNGKVIRDWIDKWHTVNLNCLMFSEGERVREKGTIFDFPKADCIYYGTPRKDRIETMLKYNTCDYVLSITPRNIVKFHGYGVRPKRTVPNLTWVDKREGLNRYKYSLYIEDTHTNTYYAFMANRFYECMMCDVLLFYDRACINTVGKSGYNIDEYQMVSNGRELQKKIKELDSDNDTYEEILHRQRSNFPMILKEKKKVVRQLKNILG